MNNNNYKNVMKMKKTIMSLLMFAIIAIIVSSCNKDNNSTTTTSVQTNLAQKVALIQGVYSHVFNLVCQASNDSAIMSGLGHLNGATVTYNSGTHTFTFMYGNLKSSDSTSGVFVATVTEGNFQDSAATCLITFNGYSVNGYTFQGSNSITNLGGTTIKTFTDSITNTKIVKGTDTTTFNGSYKIEWDNGVSTPSFSDDQFTFQSDNFNVVTNNNCTVTGNISPANKLRITTQCQYIVYGIINMTMHSLDSSNQNVTNVVTIDFITADSCNPQVNVTVDNTQYSFPL